MSAFENLNRIDVNGHTEQKNGLTYLSWAWAWAEAKKAYPEATYNIKRNAEGLPYVYDDNTGYMVFTEITIDGLTHEMWLPVMDGANKAMKSEPYTYKTKYGEKNVDAATMFDINKTIMRCLVKNLAMFGLGLYIYAGEDLPESQTKSKCENVDLKKPNRQSEPKAWTEEELTLYTKECSDNLVDPRDVANELGIKSKNDMYLYLPLDVIAYVKSKADDKL